MRYRMYVCVFMSLITTLVLCDRSQDLVMIVSVRRVHIVFSTAGFKGGEKLCRTINPGLSYIFIFGLKICRKREYLGLIFRYIYELITTKHGLRA